MKRNKEKVPEFDEIIFENRNKTYGAYDLRKHYKSAASLSILGGIALSTILIAALAFNTEDGKATTGPPSVVIIMSTPVPADFTPPEDPKPPAAMTNVINNLKPVVSEDTAEISTYIPTNDERQNTVQNGNVNDTTSFVPITEQVIPPDPEPVVVVQEMPEFPGGPAALLKYVGENLNYPADAQNNNIQGKVILKFVVKSDGSVDRIEILRGIDPLLDNEAIRVVKTLPRFKPGRQGGVAVPVWFMLPVTFKIQNN
jgi:periplasmic protein TonB